MNWRLQSLLFSLICALATGFILPSDWSGVFELLGITALTACIVLPIPNEENLWISQFRKVLFFGGAGLVLFSPFLKTSAIQYSWAIWITAISLYTTLSGAFLGLLGTLNRVQLAFVLYSISSLGIGLGYLGRLYFPV